MDILGLIVAVVLLFIILFAIEKYWKLKGKEIAQIVVICIFILFVVDAIWGLGFLHHRVSER
jgi:hypothetical protein